MMKTRNIRVFVLIAMLLSAITVPAQNLPKMAADAGVVTGKAPNGMKYYIASNPSVKGRMEAVLVQVVNDSVPFPVCDTLPHVGDVSAFKKRNGYSMGPEGFASRKADALVYRYRRIPILNGSVTVDSTLLFLMDMSCVPVGGGLVPSEDQAIILSGDIDAKDVEKRLKMLSYMLAAGKSVSESKYVWNEEKPTVYVQTVTSKNGLATVTGMFRTERASDEQMRTILPVVYEKLSDQVGQIAVSRLKNTFMDKGIPVADVSYRCVSGMDSGSDEELIINVTLEDKHSEVASETLNAVLASIARDGVSPYEMKLSSIDFDTRLKEVSLTPFKSNSEIADRCIGAYLHDLPMVSAKEKHALHTSKSMPDTTARRLLNSFASALIEAEDTVPVRSLYINMNDTLAFPLPLEKVRAKSERKEYLSGGTSWEFANGIKVIYKKMNTGDALYWTFALNGGYGNVRGLSEGEGAFMSDCLDYSYVNGVPGRDFLNILKSEGIDFNTQVNMSNVIFSGHAPEDKVELLMRSLLALARGIRVDESQLEYYKESQDLWVRSMKCTPYGHMMVIDSLMCPKYKYSGFKMENRITEGYAERTNTFFSDIFSRVNNGVLVLVGEMEDYQVKKILQNYMGGFRVSTRTVTKESMSYQPLSGSTTHVVKARKDGLLLAMSAQMQLTIDSYMAASLATMLLKQKASESLSEVGLHMTLGSNVKIYPQERANVMIRVTGAKDPIEGMSVLRSVLSDVTAKKYSEADLKLCKADLKNMISQQMKSPEYWQDALVLRYLYGKDFTTDYAARIDAVTADDVLRVLSLWNQGSKVEYIMKAR